MQSNSIFAGVIGDPISHSLSPMIHNFYLKKNNISGYYQSLLVAKEDLQQEVKTLIDKGFAGFNVTIPHKEEVFKMCQNVSEVAKLTKAVNTVLIKKDGSLYGENSDAQGFMDNVLWHHPKLSLKDKTIFIIGAGGASRAIIYSFIMQRVKKIIITNRNKEKALKVVDNFYNLALSNNCLIEYIDFKEFQFRIKECDFLVNTTSLGMINQDPLKIDISNLPKDSIVADIVYKPLFTDLLSRAQSQNNPIVTGIGMLINQALVGFEMWFGVKEVFNQKLNDILLAKL